jgi:hypothetical protein
MTPLLKLQTARLAVRAASEAVELIGGNGYIEECVTARFFRDAQVLPVWEGTTNILYLDALRWIVKEQAHHAVCERIEHLGGAATALRHEMDDLGKLPAHEQPVMAKRLSDALWQAYLVTRLEAASTPRLAAVAARLAGRPAMPLREEYDVIVRGAMG